MFTSHICILFSISEPSLYLLIGCIYSFLFIFQVSTFPNTVCIINNFGKSVCACAYIQGVLEKVGAVLGVDSPAQK
jgi:hypothetical protein